MRLPAAAIDLALLVDVYHEFWYPQEMLRSIRAALRPKGQLVLLEYRKEDPKLPIHPNHKMSVSEVRTELEAEGLVFAVFTDLSTAVERSERPPSLVQIESGGRWPTSVSAAVFVHHASRVPVEGRL